MPQETSLKIAMIGCGNIARVHARFLLKVCRREHLAICDRDELRLSAFAEQTGISNTFNDLAKLLQEFKPDIVHVLTPPMTHKAVILQCLSAGAHVLAEKPLCVTSQEADDIKTFADNCGKKVCVSHMRSFDPMIARVREMMAREDYGRIINISVGYTYDYLQRVHFDPAARWINRLPGGSFFDLMPHVLCLLKDFLPDLKLDHKKILVNEDGVITDVSCLFVSGDQTAHLHMSLRTLPLKNCIEFECERGFIRVDFRNFLIVSRRFKGLPNAVERILGNLSVGGQYVFGSIASVFRFTLGRLDPYAGIGLIISEFIRSVELDSHVPVPVSRAKDLLVLSEQVFDAEFLASQAEEHKNEMKDADILVTGGTGFIGKHLVNRLISKGHRVRVLSHRNIRPEKLKSMYIGDVDFYHGDIYSYDNVREACTGVKAVFHFAAAMSGDRNYFLDTTITGTRNVLKALKEHGIKHLVYASTLNVYHGAAYENNASVNEDFSYEPHPERRGAYSHSKLEAEKLLKEFWKNNPDVCCVAVRPGLVYGPGGKDFFNDVAFRRGRWAIFMGMGGRKLPFVYVENLIDAVMIGFDNLAKIRFGIFNVVDPDYPTQNEYYSRWRDLTQKRMIPVHIPLFIFYSGFWCLDVLFGTILRKPKHLVYKIRSMTRSPQFSTKRMQDLGWRPKVNFADGLRLTVASADKKAS